MVTAPRLAALTKPTTIHAAAEVPLNSAPLALSANTPMAAASTLIPSMTVDARLSIFQNSTAGLQPVVRMIARRVSTQWRHRMVGARALRQSGERLASRAVSAEVHPLAKGQQGIDVENGDRPEGVGHLTGDESSGLRRQRRGRDRHRVHRDVVHTRDGFGDQ